MAKVEKKEVLDGDDENEGDSASVTAYKQYIIEVMAAMVFYDNSTTDLEKHIPSMKAAAEAILKISKVLYEVRI